MRSIKVKGLVFDLDNTLYDETVYFTSVLKEFCRQRKICEKVVTKALVKRLLFLRQDILSSFLRDCYVYKNEFQRELFELYKSKKIRLRMYPDAKKIIDLAKKKGLKLGILTNGVVNVQKNKIKNLNIAKSFKVLCFCRKVNKKLEKPHEAAFKAVAKKMRINPKNLIFIGDNPRIDFKGAKKIGAFTVRLKRGVYKQLPCGPFVDREVNDLNKIKAWL